MRPLPSQANISGDHRARVAETGPGSWSKRGRPRPSTLGFSRSGGMQPHPAQRVGDAAIAVTADDLGDHAVQSRQIFALDGLME